MSSVREGNPMRAISARLNSVAIVGLVAAFGGLEAAAMHLYPGGTWWDAAARGHRFWENFLCDLEWRVALNGEPNPVGSALAKTAMLLLLVALVPFWLAVPRVFPGASAGARAAVTTPGLVSAAATVAVVLMPSDRFGALHGAMVIVAGVPGLVAAALAVRGLALREPRPRVAAGLGGAMLAAAFVDFALYVSHFAAHTNGTPLGPALQKVALLLLLAWMVTVAVRSAPSSGSGSRRPG
jgi:hypothetical protein